MTTPSEAFGPSIDLDILRVKHGETAQTTQPIATEIPFTIEGNGTEIVTLLCSPVDLKELAYGYLYTSGFINEPKDILSYSCDTTRWVASVEMSAPPDPELMKKRLYTSGCGKGVMYASLNEISARHPLQSSLRVPGAQIVELATWLQHCSELYRATGGVHSAALSDSGATPQFHCDDVGRHNAVDKVIGKGLMDGFDFSKAVLISSGRMSSEILHKAKRTGVAIAISRGAPTHQTVLRARDMGVTVIGFARGGAFTVYSHKERVTL